MPSIQQLRYLVAIADTLNFSRAAEACNVTQPTLSMQLRELELRLDVQLVERTRSRVALTPTGEAVVARARDVLAKLSDIREIASLDNIIGLKGVLHMGVVQSVGAYVLSVAMSSIKRAYPDLRIVVREDRLENLKTKLADGSHDAILLPCMVEDPEFVATRLLREPFHLVLPSDHPLALQQTIEPRQLAKQTILSMEDGHSIHEQISSLCAEVGAVHAKDYAGNTLDTLRLMVACGMGMTLLPALYVRSDVERETLVTARPLLSMVPSRDLHMVWRKSSPRQGGYLALAQLIAACAAPWGISQD